MHFKHICLDAFTKYFGKFWGQGTHQPVFIRELSVTLEKAYSVRISSIKPRDACCHLCQISPRINRVTELARYLQFHEESNKKFPGAFDYRSDKRYHELEKESYSLIHTLKIIIENDLNRTLLAYSPSPPSTASSVSPSNKLEGVSSSMFSGASDVHINDSTIHNMAGGSNVDISLTSPMTTTTTNWASAYLSLALVAYILVKKIF